MKAVFAGSFDPFTLGHYDIVKRALMIFDKIIIAVAEDTGKNTAQLSERVALAKSSVLDLCQTEVMGFSGLTTDFCRKYDANILVRGLRSAKDFDYESGLAAIYRQTANLEIVYIMSDFPHISSSVVREIAGEGKSIDGLVAKNIYSKVLELYGKR